MHCSSCNKEIKDDAVFCRCCGKKHNPSDLDLLDKSLHKLDWKFYFKRAEALVDNRKFHDALEYFEKAIDLNPTDLSIYNARGNCYKRILCCQRFGFMYVEALDDFNTALALDSDNLQTLINIGEAEVGLRKHKEALETFKKVLSIDPLNVDALVNNAFAKLQTGDYKGVKKDALTVLKLNPNHSDCLRIYGLSLLRLCEFKKGVAILEKAAGMGSQLATNALKNMEPEQYLIVVELGNKGFVLTVIDDRGNAESYCEKLSSLSNNYPFNEMYKIEAKLKYITSYNIKGTQIYIEKVDYCSSNGEFSVYALKIEVNTFCLKSFIKERENHSSVFDNAEITEIAQIEFPNMNPIAN